MTDAISSRAGTLWIAHNYSSEVGYAWANISGMFSSIAQAAREKGCNVVLSYAKLESPSFAPVSDIYTGVFEFDPYHLTLRTLVSLRRNIKKFSIRYVYLTDQPTYGLLYLALWSFGLKTIINHSRVSVPNPYPATPESGWRRIIKRRLNRSSILTPHTIYAVSNFVAHRVREQACFPSEKIRVIYNGVDLVRFAPERCGPSHVEPVVFTGCRASKHKGVDILLRACAIVLRAHPEVKFKLRFAGDGYYLPDLKMLAEELAITNYVDFLGEVKDVAAEICSATVIVVPSNWGDACPSAVLEALAAGKPLIATHAGGIPELVDDGKSGILVPPGDADALSHALHKILTDSTLRARLSEQARIEAQQRFTKERYHRDVASTLLSDMQLR